MSKNDKRKGIKTLEYRCEGPVGENLLKIVDKVKAFCDDNDWPDDLEIKPFELRVIQTVDERFFQGGKLANLLEKRKMKPYKLTYDRSELEKLVTLATLPGVITTPPVGNIDPDVN